MPAPDYATEIADLTAGLASGYAEIENADGSRIRYRGVAEIQSALATFEGLKAKASGNKSRTTYASFARD